jgi:NAD-dependent isocitrate dehydrogenase
MERGSEETQMDIVLIPGDGIGPEITASVKAAAAAMNLDVSWHEYHAGSEYYQQSGKLVEDGLMDAIAQYGTALKGPTATPIGKGFRSINVMLRQQFGTYANLRPVHSIRGVKTRYDNVDMVIIRENSEDLYKGIEYMYDQNTAHGIKLITRAACVRIAEFAFAYARRNHRRKVTCVQKANIMKMTDGMFLACFKEVAEKYPDVESDSCLVDAFCMKTVTDPSQFDVVVTENLYGDIVSDLCAGLVGGLGFAPSANIGDTVRIYEAVHGSAPDIAGQDKANPTAILMSFVMLLNDYGHEAEAQKLQNAIDAVIEEGKHTTGDIGGTAGTKEFTEAVIERLK